MVAILIEGAAMIESMSMSMPANKPLILLICCCFDSIFTYENIIFNIFSRCCVASQMNLTQFTLEQIIGIIIQL